MLVTQLCPSLCDPMDYSPPGSSVHEILQARILKWIAVPFSRYLPDPGIELRSFALQVDSLPSEPLGKPLIKRDLLTLAIQFYKFKGIQQKVRERI